MTNGFSAVGAASTIFAQMYSAHAFETSCSLSWMTSLMFLFFDWKKIFFLLSLSCCFDELEQDPVGIRLDLL